VTVVQKELEQPMPVSPIPDGYHSVTAYLIVKGAARAIEFYQQAFGATEITRLDGPGGTIGHAEVMIGDSPVMLADEHPDMGALSPETVGGSPVNMLIYTADADAMFQRALDTGAEQVRPMADQFYGDRSGTVRDPFGHQWTIATHVEDVSQEELQRRMEEMMQQGG
jgi:PhnB protein